jgi:hypothetical protein
MAELAMAHELAGERRGAAQLAAELAHDAGLALVYVDALPHEWGALTVDAAMAVGGQRPDAASQEDALELLDIAMRGGHHG